ncbi:MAG: alpha/beta hydrolase [Thermodesulfobacteriota bacterium]|nr:alpha/beta hydrolase [Thermodesulfobacteriota bacterium]
MIKILEIGGLGIACRVNDGGFIRGRRNLIFVHGSGVDHAVWDGQFDAMEKDFNMAALDLPGHGSSGGGGEEDVYLYMEWVRKAVEMLSMESPVIVGHSLGAAISLALALACPGMLSGIVVVGGGARMPVSKMVFDGIRDNFQGFIALSPDFAVHRENLEGVRGLLLEGFSRAKPEVFFGDFTACNGFDIEGRLGEINLPTLIVCGEKDMMMPPEFSQALNEKIEGSLLEMVPVCGHFPMLEKKAAFNAIIEKFVGAL